MPDTSSERRLGENEAIFRKLNEQVTAGFQETNKLARKDNQPEFMVTAKGDDELYQFYCECADENCTMRVPISLRDYRTIHKHRKQFTIAPGHEVISVEKIVTEKPGFSVVEKHETPPEKPETLHPTSVNNQCIV